MVFSQTLACPDCGINLPEIEPRLFSFNNPFGACPSCNGLGVNMEIEPDLVIPDRRKSISDGAIVPWYGTPDGYYMQLLYAVCAHMGIPTEVPVDSLTEDQINIILSGSGRERIPFHYENQYGRTSDRMITFEGVIPNLERRYKSAPSEAVRQWVEEFMAARPCPNATGAVSSLRHWQLR